MLSQRAQDKTAKEQCHLKGAGHMETVIRLDDRTERQSTCGDGGRIEKTSTEQELTEKKMRESALKYGTLWICSVGFQDPSDGKVCACD